MKLIKRYGKQVLALKLVSWRAQKLSRYAMIPTTLANQNLGSCLADGQSDSRDAKDGLAFREVFREVWKCIDLL